jgi:hypothetical protein
MANTRHVAILREEGVDVWNDWRIGLSDRPDFSGANFRKAMLKNANLSNADLNNADLTEADLLGASLREARLSGAKVDGANLAGADLCGSYISMGSFSHANLCEANLCRVECFDTDFSEADLRRACLNAALLSTPNLSGADLTEADMRGAVLGVANLERSRLINCRVYGISVWDVRLNGAIQKDLIITTDNEPTIMVDELEVAQFVYLLLHNAKIRYLIDTITSKVVLILGRFTPERKAVLDAIRQELRSRGYAAVLFDFEKPRNLSTMETVSTLAGMARFVIADLTDAKSVLQELRDIVPSRPSLPIQPILISTQAEPGMFDFFKNFLWVLPTRYYSGPDELLSALKTVIEPAERRLLECMVSPPPTQPTKSE